MAYTVLARRFRSQTFDDVLGQDAIARTLKNAIKTGRVAHAYLFTGTRGVGKTTMARILAKALNCLKADGPTTEPCCKCESCVAVNLGEDIDVIEIDGASNTGVDNIRQLRQNAIYRPARARHKIYIIDEVHMLSTGAFNALLKILEEPPDHVKFIFATTEPNKVLPTIQSRCQRFDFVNISPSVIAGQLKSILESEKVTFEKDVVVALSRLANGSMRDALSLLDQMLSTAVEPLTVELLEEALGQPSRQKVFELVERIGDSDAAGVLEMVDGLLSSGQTAVQIVDTIVELMRDLIVVQSNGLESDLLVLTAEERKAVSQLAEKFDTAALIYNITALEKLRWTIKNSDNPRALLEASLLRLSLSEQFIGISRLLSGAGSSGGRSAAARPAASIKKKPLRGGESDSCFGSSPEGPQSPGPVARIVNGDADSESIAENWPAILQALKAVDAALGAYLELATVGDFDGSRLTLLFPKTSPLERERCQKRIGHIEKLLSEAVGSSLKVQIEATGKEAPRPSPPVAGARMDKKTRQEALSDPGVQTLLTLFDAKVTDIEKVDATDESGIYEDSE
jgi:DNA polymerase-3 subunit gamma/tau